MIKRTKLTFCFDIDNTFCKTKGNQYEQSKPVHNAIKTINRLYENGHTIKIFTARYMGKFNGDIEKVYSFGYDSTLNQLRNWNLKFNKLVMGKVEYDIFIDDKNLDYKVEVNKFSSLTKN